MQSVLSGPLSDRDISAGTRNTRRVLRPLLRAGSLPAHRDTGSSHPCYRTSCRITPNPYGRSEGLSAVRLLGIGSILIVRRLRVAAQC
jgi:hypothetical protein